jgi:RNAse (barnase) inhibitor barstar
MMHNTERLMINEQLSQLFDLADDLRCRIDALAEMVANSPQAPAQVLQVKRKDDYERVVKELQDLVHLLTSSKYSQATSDCSSILAVEWTWCSCPLNEGGQCEEQVEEDREQAVRCSIRA